MIVQEEQFKKILGTDPPRNFLPINMRLVVRIREDSIKLKRSEELLYSYLRNEHCLAYDSDKQRDEFGQVYVELSQKEVALQIGLTRATVCVGLKNLEKIGLIQREHIGGTRPDRIYVFDKKLNESYSDQEKLSQEEKELLEAKAQIEAKLEILNKIIDANPEHNHRFIELIEQSFPNCLAQWKNETQEPEEPMT